MVKIFGEIVAKGQAGPLSWRLSLPLALSGGVLQTLSWPWPGWWPLSFVALIPLLRAVQGQGSGRAFWLGWAYGLSLSVASLPWLAYVLDYYGGLGPVLGWLVILLLAMFLALFKGLFGWLAAKRGSSSFIWVLTGSVVWCGLDWFQNWVFTGFNWTPLGGPIVMSPQLSQAGSLIGFYGLSFIAALVNFCLYLAMESGRGVRRFSTISPDKNGQARYDRFTAPVNTNIARPPKTRRQVSPALAPLAFVMILLAGLFVWGDAEYRLWEERAAAAPARIVSVIQPSTDQMNKWDEGHRLDHLRLFERLNREAASHDPWFTLWPETALPFIFDYHYVESEWLRRMSRETGGLMLAGLTALSGQWPKQKMHNRMLLFNGGKTLAHYDKVHLVPFGEYLPEWIPFAEWPSMQGVLGAAGTFSSGYNSEPVIMPLDPADPQKGGVRLGVLVCFESTFPYLGRYRVLEGADLLVVPTNDGWFGRSRAPGQHLRQAAMRSIELRRPLVRAANTGISAVIYPSGRIAGHSELYEVGAFPFKVPVMRNNGLTPFVRWGYLLAPATAVLTGFMVLILAGRAAALRLRRRSESTLEKR